MKALHPLEQKNNDQTRMNKSCYSTLQFNLENNWDYC